MKKLLLIAILALIGIHITSAQVGIGTASPDTTAALDHSAGNKSFLPSRLSTEEFCGVVLNSDNNQQHNPKQKIISHQSNKQFSNTEVSSYLKAYGVDSWIITKTTNSSIVIETYPAKVGSNTQSNRLNYPLVNVKKPDGSFLVENHENHQPSKFFTIPADSPNGEYKIEVGVYKNDSGGYILKCLSNNEYFTILENITVPEYTETHNFNDTPATEWTITQSESFSLGNDVHQWNVNLLEGENLIIDLYNLEPFICKFGPNETFWDALDTKLYLLDADNNLIMEDDDGGNDKNARIYYTVPSSGTYKVIATNYGKFTANNWNVNLDYQADNWDLGTTGITYYNLTIASSSNLPFTFEDIELSNPDAIKINAVLLTNDETLEQMPVSNSHINTLIADLNTAYSELYDTVNWPGFELAGITKFYSPQHAQTGAPHDVLSEIGSSPAAKQNYLNLIFTEIDENQTGILGTTYLYYNTNQSNGASIVLDDDAGSAILIHEMGHVIGMNHIAGTWPPKKHTLALQEATMGYLTNYISRPENSYMSTWISWPYQYQPFINLYLTSQPATLKTISYGDLFSEGFRSWLITNEYIGPEAPSTDYEGNDTPTSASNEWTHMETIPIDDNAVFTAIASSGSSENNHAAYAYHNSAASKLYYGSLETDNSWSQNTYETNVGRHKLVMNSRGDAIILIQPWYSNTLTALYKNHDQNQWSSPQIVGNSEKYIMRSNVAINNSGDVAVVWLEINNNGDRIIKFNEMVNREWVGEHTISNSAQIKELPSVDYNNNKDVIISWQEWDINNSGRFDIVGKFRRGSSAVFGNLETYSDLSNHAGFSQVAMNGSGDVIVYWRQASGAFVSGQSQSAAGILKARYRNLDGSLESIVDLSPSGEDSLNASAELTGPRIVFKGDNAALTWWGANANHNVIYASIMVNKTSWNSTALTTPGKSADLSSIAMDNEGMVAVAWQRTDGLNQRVQTKFYNPSTASWSSAMTVSTLGVDAIHADITVDGNGGATVAWAEWNSASGKYSPVIKKYTAQALNTRDITKNEIKIYPNPAKDYLNITGVTFAKERYMIFNIQGKRILSGTLETNQNISIKDLKAGLYFLKFNNGNAHKFIKY